MAGKDNLNPPIKTTEEAREKGRAGGIKSGQRRKERKLMSQIYAEFLAKKHKVSQGEEITGDDLLEKVMMKVLARGDGAAVSMMREIREATEGNKLDVLMNNKSPVKIIVEGIDPEDTSSEKTDSDIQE